MYPGFLVISTPLFTRQWGCRSQANHLLFLGSLHLCAQSMSLASRSLGEPGVHPWVLGQTDPRSRLPPASSVSWDKFLAFRFLPSWNRSTGYLPGMVVIKVQLGAFLGRKGALCTVGPRQWQQSGSLEILKRQR